MDARSIGAGRRMAARHFRPGSGVRMTLWTQYDVAVAKETGRRREMKANAYPSYLSFTNCR